MLSALLVLIGICGVLSRRNLLAVTLCFHLITLGIALLFSTSFALLLLTVFSLQVMVTCGIAIFVYRHSGTLNVDEFRQLRG